MSAPKIAAALRVPQEHGQPIPVALTPNELWTCAWMVDRYADNYPQGSEDCARLRSMATALRTAIPNITGRLELVVRP